MKNRKIINIILVIFVVIGIAFIIKFDLFGKIENKINDEKIRNEALNKDNDGFSNEPEFITETFTDEDGNEIVVKMKKRVVTDLETGEEVLMYEDASEPKAICDHMYKGMIQKIDDNKIYFLVDKESKNGSYFCEDVEDYQVVFDIDEYNFKSDPYIDYSFCDEILYVHKKLEEPSVNINNADDLKFLLGDYIRVQYVINIDVYTDEEYKTLLFYE
jgi:hypothetical protein